MACAERISIDESVRVDITPAVMIDVDGAEYAVPMIRAIGHEDAILVVHDVRRRHYVVSGRDIRRAIVAAERQ